MTRPGPRGYRWPGGGRTGYLPPPQWWRGTTRQVCGLWPYAAGSGTPMIGVPIGHDLLSGATLCCDPISWFARAHIIANPSQIVLGKPGLGKSTLLRRQVLGLAGYGVTPMILGDLRPDYADLIAAMGGQVIKLGRGLGTMNVLDPGETGRLAARLSGQARSGLLADAAGRRLNMVTALLTVLRKHPISDHERTVLAAALRVLAGRHHGVPTLPDLVQVIDEGPAEVRAVTLERGDDSRYRQAVDPLHASLIGLLDGPMGEVFAHPTSTALDLDASGGVCFDISGIDDSDADLAAAVLLACWSDGFAAINAAQTLADHRLAPRRHFFLIMDEMWRVLRAGPQMVDRTDALTRLNRQKGVGQAMASHSLSDWHALDSPADLAKAKGFSERAGMIICAGMPAAETTAVQKIVGLSERECQLLVGWSSPPSLDAQAQKHAPGLGNLLVKVGGRPGIPVHVDLTRAELALNDTNQRWRQP